MNDGAFSGRQALGLLSKLDRARLVRIGGRFAFGCSHEPQDLLHQAVVRALMTSVVFQDKQAFLRYLLEGMKSVAFDERKKASVRALDVAGLLEGDAKAGDSIPHSGSVLDGVLDEEAATEKLQLLRALVRGNENAELVLEGRLDGMKPPAIREALGLTETEYDSAVTLINRRIDKHVGKRPKQ